MGTIIEFQETGFLNKRTKWTFEGEMGTTDRMKKIQLYRTSTMKIEIVPEPDPFEVVSATWQRDEGNQNAGLHLGHPLFGLVLLDEHYRLRPPPAQ